MKFLQKYLSFFICSALIVISITQARGAGLGPANDAPDSTALVDISKTIEKDYARCGEIKRSIHEACDDISPRFGETIDEVIYHVFSPPKGWALVGVEKSKEGQVSQASAVAMVPNLKANDAVSREAGCQQLDSLFRKAGLEYDSAAEMFNQAYRELYDLQAKCNNHTNDSDLTSTSNLSPDQIEQRQNCRNVIRAQCNNAGDNMIGGIAERYRSLANAAKKDSVGAMGSADKSAGSCSANALATVKDPNAKSTSDNLDPVNPPAVKSDSMNPWLAGGIGAVVGAGATVGILAATGNLGGSKGGGGSSATHSATTPTTTTSNAPPALATQGETAEGSQNLNDKDAQKSLAKTGTQQNLSTGSSSGSENQGALGRSGSALSSGGGASAGSGSALSAGAGGSSGGAQGRVANARSSALSGGGGYSPSSSGGGDGNGKDQKDGAAIGYAAALKGCQPKVAKQIRDSKTKKMLTVMIDNPNYKTCRTAAEAKSALRTPASSKVRDKIKKDALLK